MRPEIIIAAIKARQVEVATEAMVAAKVDVTMRGKGIYQGLEEAINIITDLLADEHERGKA